MLALQARPHILEDVRIHLWPPEVVVDCKPQRIFLILLSRCEAACEFDRGSPFKEKKERRKREQRFYGVRWAQAE